MDKGLGDSIEKVLKATGIDKVAKKVLGDDLFDKSLVNETTEPIYDYIVEKTYQTPGYIEEVEFKNKRKLKIAFNKFYENLTRDTK